MARQKPDGPASRAQNAGGVAGVLVAFGTGTTDAVASTSEPVLHGALDENGNPYAAANLRCFAFPTTNEAPLYQFAAPTATQIDIGSTGTAVPYIWFLFAVNV
jgi:hypothetical protein